jgi:hypothetical protein
VVVLEATLSEARLCDQDEGWTGLVGIQSNVATAVTLATVMELLTVAICALGRSQILDIGSSGGMQWHSANCRYSRAAQGSCDWQAAKRLLRLVLQSSGEGARDFELLRAPFDFAFVLLSEFGEVSQDIVASESDMQTHGFVGL